jgi:hypothetical protein
MGLYPTPKRQRYKNINFYPVGESTIQHGQSARPTSFDDHLPYMMPSPSINIRETDLDPSSQLLAYLYSLNTPGTDRIMLFGSDMERICIDTGASACISTRRENFITFKPVNNIKINGIGTGLPVEGTGTLKWTISDDKHQEIELHVRDALFVPSAPMGLLCPQQIAMQTKLCTDGFNALGHAGILTFAGYKRTVPYDPRSRLPILTSIDGAHCYLANEQHQSAEFTENLTGKQKLLL